MTTKILIVDDEPDLEFLIRRKLRQQIRTARIQFVYAGNGVEALQAIEQDESIEIVITDIRMPQMDGLTLLGRLHEMDRLFKVIIVSAYGDISNIRSAMNQGAFDFLTKPVDFEDLLRTIQKTRQEITQLKQGLESREQLIEVRRELEIANKIQHSLIPSDFSVFDALEHVELYATMIPAREVGGDFYDYFFIDEHHLGVCIADVSGKGVGAALFMAVARTMLRSNATHDLPAHECVTRVNRLLALDNKAHLFVTLFYGVLDLRTGRLDYCNAGHHQPFLVNATDEPQPLRSGRGIGLCLRYDFVYPAGEVQLNPGDSLFLFTDGITEATDQTGLFFSEQSLLDVLSEAGDLSPAGLIRNVLRQVDTFTGGMEQSDDITMLALKFYG